MVNQREVNRANFAGRLHPSQRKRVLDRARSSMVLIAAGVLILVPALERPPGSWSYWIPLVLSILAIAFGLWTAGRRVLEVLAGRVRSTSGSTPDEGQLQPEPRLRNQPIVMYPATSRLGRNYYCMKVGEQAFTSDLELNSRVHPGRVTTVFFTPRTKRVVNVAPTPESPAPQRPAPQSPVLESPVLECLTQENDGTIRDLRRRLLQDLRFLQDSRARSVRTGTNDPPARSVGPELPDARHE